MENRWKQEGFMLSGWLLTWHTDNERLDEYISLLKDAGIDLLLFDGNPKLDFDKVYDACKANDMKILSTVIELAYDEEGKPYSKGIIKQPKEINEEKIRSEIERLKHKYPNTIIGHYIWDEPNMMMFDRLVETANIVRKYDPASLMYSVILPSYGRYVWPDEKVTYDTEAAIQNRDFMEKNAASEATSSASYPEYVDEYCKVLNPEILAQDYYPFQQHGLNTGLKTSVLWKDMGYLRKVAKARNMEYWQCISGVEDWTWTTSNYMDVPRIRVHLNASIAYGCSGVQYFPLHEAIVMLKTPEKSSKYEQLKIENIKAKNIGNLLFHTDSTALYHTAGYDNPQEIFADDIKSSRFIANVKCSADFGLIISEFTTEDSIYLVAVNKDHVLPAYGKIELHKEFIVEEFDAINNSFLTPVKTNEIEYKLEAGEIVLYQLA